MCLVGNACLAAEGTKVSNRLSAGRQLTTRKGSWGCVLSHSVVSDSLTHALCPARPSFMRIPQAGILESVAKLSSRGLPNQGLNLKVNVMSNSL